MVKCLPEFELFFTVFLKNKNIIFKIRRSKVTDYAALSHLFYNQAVWLQMPLILPFLMENINTKQCLPENKGFGLLV